MNRPLPNRNRGALPPSAAKLPRPRRVAGAVMLEFVIVFPLFLVLVLACIQFAHLWVARMVVHYAAYAAARSALVCHTGQYNGSGSAPSESARIVCTYLQQPWSGSGTERTRTTVESTPQWNVTATTTHEFSLIVPIVGQMLAWGMKPWDRDVGWDTPGRNGANTDGFPLYPYPTVILRESVTLPKPYVTVDPAQF